MKQITRMVFVGVCQPFQYAGCGGNGNRFATSTECRKQCNDETIRLLKGPNIDENRLHTTYGNLQQFHTSHEIISSQLYSRKLHEIIENK